MLHVAGACADSVLLWAIPRSDLPRSAAIVARGAMDRPGAGPELVWAPLVDYGGASRERLRDIAAYSVLEQPPGLHAAWGLEPPDTARAARAAGGRRSRGRPGAGACRRAGRPDPV